MAIEFVCPACGGTLRVGDETAGRVIRCGGCMTALRVPDAGEGSGPPAPPGPYDGARAYPPPDSAPEQPARARAGADPLPGEAPAAARPVAPPRRRPDPTDDRPRERRSRRPPPPAGYGAFFWLVVVGAVMLVGVVLCCGGLLLVLPDAKWQTHESRDGGFRVDLPGKPQPDVASAAKLKLEAGTHAEGTILLKRGAERFLVIYRDIGSAQKRGTTDEKELDARINRIQNALEAEQLSSRPITVNGFVGREITLQSKTAGWHTARVIVADTRLYILLAGGGMALPGDPLVSQFLESFEITEPALVKEGKRREEQAKLAAEIPEGAKKRGAKAQAGREEQEIKQREDDEAEAAKKREDDEAEAAKKREAKAQEERQKRRDEERRKAEAKRAAELANLRDAAMWVAKFALADANEVARAARDAAPRLEVAPPPRPVGD